MRILFAFTCVVVAILLGCSRGFAIRYINNTDDEIIVRVLDTDYRVAPGGAIEKAAASQTDDFPIVIKTKKSQKLRFDLGEIPVPPEFWGDEKLNQIGLVLQFQDKKLYLLSPTNTTATTNIPVQPPGFPLLAINPDQYWIGSNEVPSLRD